MSMTKIQRRMPAAAMIVAVVALSAALAGSALAGSSLSPNALLKKNTVGASDLKRNSVGSSELRKNAVKSADVAGGAVRGDEIADGAVTGADVDESTLELSIPGDQVQEYPRGSFRVAASVGPTEAAARAAAPEIPLTKVGSLSLYGKCFFDDADDDVLGEVYLRTTQNGSIFESRSTGGFQGGPAASDFLNVDTPEVDRRIEASEEVTVDEANVDYDDEEPFMAAAPDGTQIHGLFEVAVKNGNLAAGNGIYGPGNACIFTGYTFG